MWETAGANGEDGSEAFNVAGAVANEEGLAWPCPQPTQGNPFILR